MDTGRLLKTIEDIQGDEAKFGLQAKFQNVANYYSQNNPDALNSERETLKKSLEESLLYNYVQSDFKILDHLGIRGMFGEESYQTLEEVLSSQAHEIQRKLTEFTQKRQAVLTRLEQTKVSLASFDLNARTLTDGQFEIGFSFPIEYQNVDRLEDALGDIKILLGEIASAIHEPADFKISYVSNSSIEIYIQATLALARHFDVLVDYALKVYGIVGMTRDIKNRIDNFSKERKKDIEKHIKEERNEKVEALIQEMNTKLDISEPDIQSRISIEFKRLLKHLEQGVVAEVRTPHINPPSEPPETADEQEKKHFNLLKEEYRTKKEIDQRNRDIYKLQSKGFDGLDTKFLDDGRAESV